MGPETLRRRCPSRSPAAFEASWTAFLLPSDGSLWIVGLHAPLIPAGEPMAATYARHVVGNDEVLHVVETFSSSAAARAPRRVTVGRSRLELGERAGALALMADIAPAGAPAVRIDARVSNCNPTWRSEHPEVISDDARGVCGDYEVLCPRGTLTGSLEVDGVTSTLDGTGFVERIRWLDHPAERIAWYWGIAHAGNEALVFYVPFYPGARSLLYVGDQTGCTVCAEGFATQLPAPGLGAQPIDLALAVPGGRVRLQVQAPHRPDLDATVTVVAPFSLEITAQGRSRHLAGTMVIETGTWPSF